MEKVWASGYDVLRISVAFMLVTSKATKHLHSLPTSITIDNAQIPFKQSLKNLILH